MLKLNLIMWLLVILPLPAIAENNTIRHPHDLANEKIRDGDYQAAVKLSHQALEIELTAEGYCTLGIAYEGIAEYDKAIEAYSNALKLDNENTSIKRNRTRAKLRRLIWINHKIVLVVFIASVSLLLLINAYNYISAAWGRYCINKKYNRVTVSQLEITIYDQDGEKRIGSQIYPDSTMMAIKCAVDLPDCCDIYPLSVELNLQDPVNKSYHREITEITDYNAGKRYLEYNFDNLTHILESAGQWRIVIKLKQTGKTLVDRNIVSVSKKMLLDDLIVSGESLLAIKKDNITPASHIPDDIECVCALLKLAPRNYLPNKYKMPVQVRLFSPNSSTPISVTSISLNFNLGPQEIGIEYSLTELHDETITGHWKFEFLIEEKILSEIPFEVISRQQAISNFELSNVMLAGIGPKGGVFPLQDSSYRRPVTISPIYSFRSKVIYPLVMVPVLIGVCIDDEPVAEFEDTIQLVDDEIDWIPVEYQIPEWDNERQKMEISFVLFVDNKVVVTKSVVLRKKAPYCADSQGRLTNIREFQINSSDVSEILQEAQVR